MIAALIVYVQDGKARGLSSPASYKELGMGARDRFENFRVGQLPLIIGRVPGATGQRLVDVSISMEHLKEFRDTGLPPLREVILSRKSSRPALRLRARLNMSGNGGLPFLIWDELT